jgi:hypothetical protein
LNWAATCSLPAGNRRRPTHRWPTPGRRSATRAACYGARARQDVSLDWSSRSSRNWSPPVGCRVQAKRHLGGSRRWRSGFCPRRPTNACVAHRANHASGWSSIRRENIRLLFSCKSVHPCAVPPGKRGGSRSSRNARWDAVDAEAMIDEVGLTRTAKSCGPDAAVLASSWWEVSRRRRWQKSRSPRRARSKP